MNAPDPKFIPYESREFSSKESLEKAEQHFSFFDKRRSIRTFSDRPVRKELIEFIIQTASTAPSGANKQPWTFCAVQDPKIKSEIRKAAEQEEYENYHGRMSEDWLADLRKFDTNWEKPFLETAPWLIVVFKKAYDLSPNGEKLKNYYVNESVGLAAGFLIAAIHNAGLATLTHTPSPMNFLQKVLDRPSNERPFLLMPVGYPQQNTVVPNIDRKPLKDIAVFY